VKRTFEEWMKEVDRLMWNEAQVTHTDIEDWRYRIAYDDGCTVKAAAKLALKNAGWRP
jgi:hypothetical protein